MKVRCLNSCIGVGGVHITKGTVYEVERISVLGYYLKNHGLWAPKINGKEIFETVPHSPPMPDEVA